MEPELTSAERKKLQKGKANLYRKPLKSSNPLWKFCQRASFYGFFGPIFVTVFRIMMGLKVENRHILKQLRGKGFVTVCNHVYVLDAIMIVNTVFPRQVIFTSQEETLYIRGLRTLLRLLDCVPIIREGDGLSRFLDDMAKEVRNGRIVNIYPEGSIQTMCDHLRKFAKGAFTVAARADAPVVPMVITPRERKGLWKLVRKKYSMTITVGEPIYPIDDDCERIVALQMMKDAIAEMNEMLKNGGHAYPPEDEHNPDAFWQVKKSKQI